MINECSKAQATPMSPEEGKATELLSEAVERNTRSVQTATERRDAAVREVTRAEENLASAKVTLEASLLIARQCPHILPQFAVHHGAAALAVTEHNYITVMRQNDIWLVGPFPTAEAAADYGATAQDRIWSDDPRWQTIKLTDTFGLRIEAPTLIVVYGRAARTVRV
jgi:hypothetical protein